MDVRMGRLVSAIWVWFVLLSIHFISIQMEYLVWEWEKRETNEMIALKWRKGEKND